MSDELTMLALRNRLRTVSGIPADAQCGWTNKDFTPTQGTPYLEEDYAPGPGFLVSGDNPDGGVLQARGLYVIRYYGLANQGSSAIRAVTDAILAKFAPGTTMAAGSDTVRVSGNPAPGAGPIRPDGQGWAVSTVTISWWLLTTNAILA